MNKNDYLTVLSLAVLVVSIMKLFFFLLKFAFYPPGVETRMLIDLVMGIGFFIVFLNLCFHDANRNKLQSIMDKLECE